ncbi:DUF3575 domain-containing protein [Aquimarina sp. MMG016]|uniref:DUF3575 domain-containing protein n=1 Tax=Aquimarina sp. MMG016 TaxID=2822690 RepID=UPI001B3A30A8|nr:DUF3575 domain-containing protein [Aquimarina sp. MMG016]MBQ4821018.1 DUF3575 domain-containing protein [Aquimarina sp. MMG016]
MKKILLVITLSVFSVLGIHSQETSNSIKVNPAALWDGSDLLSYERAITKHSSLLLGAGIGGFKIGGLKYKSKGASLQYRYYFTKSMNKFYFGGLIHYQNGIVETGEAEVINFFLTLLPINQDINFDSLGTGLKTGYQLVNKDGLTLDLNLGISYMSFDYKEKSGLYTVELQENGIIPTFGLGIGYLW